MSMRTHIVYGVPELPSLSIAYKILDVKMRP